MAEDLKRVGLVFKADGSIDFVKSLSLVNATLKENYEDFKLVQAQWDRSTTTTQKLKDKLEYLNNAYDIQKDKVTTLKYELEDLEQAENRDETAIQKKKAALTQAETSLQRYKNQIEETTTKLKLGTAELEEFGKKLENVGKNITEAGKKTAAFSAASAAALGMSLNSAIEFESAFIGVEKTVDATDKQLEEMKMQIRGLAKEIPATTTEISAVAEAAGQLGIKTENIMDFTKVMINMGNATNLSADVAATTLARFANVTKMSQNDFDRLGSTIVALGNNFATTEAEIADMAMNLGSAGTQIGMTQSEIVALATALSSVGLESQAGGTAFSKIMVEMQLAVEKGGGSLKDFAKVSGMTTKEFQKAFKEDATGALMSFIEGLSKSDERGKSAIKVLDDMGISETRLRDSLLRSANATDIFSGAIKVGNKAWEENDALTKEAEKRYSSLKSQIQVAGQKLIDMAISLGDRLMPRVQEIIEKVGKWIDEFSKLNDEQIDTILNIALFIAAISPVLTIIGKLTTTVGTAVKTFATLKEALAVAQGMAVATNSSVAGLASVFTTLANPVTIACAVVVGAIAGIAIAVHKSEEEIKQKFETMGDSANSFISGIDSAKSHLNEFNSTLFASSKEQQKLQEDMQKVQEGITTICQKAANERRDYTKKEIEQLDQYFQKLRELNDRELQIQQQIAAAISQQAITISETHTGSLEEYKVTSQEWINTAQQQADKEKEIINNRTTEEIALLNLRYGQKATLENEEYAREYNAIIQNKETSIAEANDQVAKVHEVYANGYTQRSLQNEGFALYMQDYNTRAETENDRHMQKIQEIDDGNFNWVLGRTKDREMENTKHNESMKKIWKDMYKNMDESQAEQMGAWLAMVAHTEMYGGKIDDESREMADNVIASFDKMPPKTREAMQNAMQPMFDEMQRKEPSLYSKAEGIANGILGRLKKAFDIHSPSRKMREIFKNVMLGGEIEMQEGSDKMISQAEKLTDNMIDTLDGMSTDFNLNTGSDVSGNMGYINIVNAFIEALKSSQIIDYKKLGKEILYAITNAKFTLDEDGFVRIIKEELYEIL